MSKHDSKNVSNSCTDHRYKLSPLKSIILIEKNNAYMSKINQYVQHRV